MLKWIWRDTLKRKVMIFVMVLLACFLSGFFYTFYATYKVNSQIENMFETSIDLNAFKQSMDQFEHSVDIYLGTKDSDSFIAYMQLKNELIAYGERFNYGKNENQILLQLNNLSNHLTAYLDEAQLAIDYKRARNTERYLEHYRDMLTIRGFMNDRMDQILMWDYNVNLENHLFLAEKIQNIQIGLILMTCVLIALSISFVYSFSTQVTRPITALSDRAHAISKGQYTFEKILINRFDEAVLLEEAFDNMSENIKQYIEELKDKVETENQLRRSETEKLKVENLLNEAELIALQSQINPHFLFNTLNAGLQLAIIEDANRTAVFLENLADLFRYNIQKLSNRVTLQNEFSNAQNYSELMRVRFGTSIAFTFDLDPKIEGLKMPPLILQPVIENAIIHGFSKRLNEAHIHIEARYKQGEATILVRDNGEGIHQETLAHLNRGLFNSNLKAKGHTTGLGLGNVYERLKHVFGDTFNMQFESEKNHFTCVKINIQVKEPLNEVVGS